MLHLILPVTLLILPITFIVIGLGMMLIEKKTAKELYEEIRKDVENRIQKRLELEDKYLEKQIKLRKEAEEKKSIALETFAKKCHEDHLLETRKISPWEQILRNQYTGLIPYSNAYIFNHLYEHNKLFTDIRPEMHNKYYTWHKAENRFYWLENKDSWRTASKEFHINYATTEYIKTMNAAVTTAIDVAKDTDIV